MKPRYTPGPNYFAESMTGALLRRDEGTDTAFYGGAWHPTEAILDYMIGEDDDVEPVSEETARANYRAAFA